MLLNNTTLNTTKNHLGSEPQKNPDAVFQVEEYKQFPKTFPVYIPNNFDIIELVKHNPPNFKYHKDYFLYLVHLITDIQSKNKDVEYNFVPFYSPLIQRRVRKYRDYLNYLVENKVLEERKQYIVGKQSRGFCFSSKYQTEIKRAFITKKTLIKSILEFISIEPKETCEDSINFEPENNLGYLLKWYNHKLTIDFKGAKSYLEDLRSQDEKHFLDKYKAMSRFNSRYIVLLKLQRQEFIHTIDSTAGRLHTVLTQLKGDLRQFVKYDGKPLVAIDVTNSQPYLSTVFFNQNKYKSNKLLERIRLYNKSYKINMNHQNFTPYFLEKKIKEFAKLDDVVSFIEIVKSGQLYEKFGELLSSKGLINQDDPIRKQAKKIIFSSIFSPNQSIAYNQPMQIFKDNFPNVYEIYRSIKQSEHRTLACVLQNLEADLVLHQACKIISELRPNAPLFTLHDAIITTDEHKYFVKEILHNVLLNAIGIPPNLKFEEWKKVA